MPPAARVGDPVLCPIVKAPTPIAVGMPTVVIGGMPAARMSSVVTCVPPDSILKGSATVLVGGLPAARMGDNSAHGGAILFGCMTVLIGG